MRRSDKEIKDPETIEKIINEAEFCRVAFSHEDNPYLVTMNFGYRENNLYLHSATEGRKIDILRKNNNVCFQMDIRTELVKSASPCNWGVNYLSVIGFGKAHIIDNHSDKRAALDVIMAKYSPRNSFEYSDEAISKVIVIKVQIDDITGKKSGY
jgi:uncharacterized protein